MRTITQKQQVELIMQVEIAGMTIDNFLLRMGVQDVCYILQDKLRDCFLLIERFKK